MSLIKFRNQTPVIDPFRSIFDDFFASEFFEKPNGSRWNTPAANIKENEKSYLVELAAPGMDKKDFTIDVNEELLTISHQRENLQEEEKEKYAVREFNYFSFKRSFRLPKGIDSKKIKASYKDGVLAIEIPKPSNGIENARRITIE